MSVLIPIGVLALAICLAFVFIREAYATKTIRVAGLFFVATIILAYVLILLVFYDNVKGKKLFDYVYIISYFLLGLVFVLNTNSSISKKYAYEQYLKCIEQDKLFVYLDKQDRIKAISKLFAKALEVDQEEVIGEKFFTVFNKIFKVITINGQPYTNEDLNKFFKNVKTINESSRIKREIKVKDIEDVEYTLNLYDHVIVFNGKYKAHCLVGDAKSLEQMTQVEAQLNENQTDLDNVRLKLSAHLEMTEESMYFINLTEGSMWGNDVFKREFVFSSNNLTWQEYASFIHPDDREIYLRTINSLTNDKPTFSMTYRMMVGGSYKYVKDFGKKIFDGIQSEIVGYSKTVQTEHYERSNIKELDSIKSVDDLLKDLNQLAEEGLPYQTVMFRMDNIPSINNEQGRSIGNMVMAEYIKAITRNFVDEKMVYRTDGLEFIFIVTQLPKMERLKQALLNNQILNASMRYANNSIKTNVYMGLVNSNEVSEPEEMLAYVDKCLRQAMRDSKKNYVYYKELR